MVLIFVCFLIYGSGAVGTEKLENQMHIWTGIYIIIGLIHLFLAYRHIKFLSKTQRLVLIFFLTIIYVYLGVNYGFLREIYLINTPLTSMIASQARKDV